jgi:predicted permease
MWGTLLIGVGFLFSIPWYIVPNLENIILGAGQISGLLLSLLYPFSTGILVASITYSNVAFVIAAVAAFAMLGYALLAFIAGKWSFGTARSISQGSSMKIARTVTKDFSVKARSQLSGFILKDLKVASRNPATAFFFALPVLETLIIALMVAGLETLGATAVIVATSMGSIFALFIPLALLTAEGRGLEYTKTLPISTRRIMTSKTIVSTASYALVPIALLVLASFKPLTSPYTILIPFITIISVASASIFEIKLFLRDTSTGKIDAVVNDIGKIFAGLLIVLIPEIAYATTFLLSFSHSLSILIMGIVASLELALATYLLDHS